MKQGNVAEKHAVHGISQIKLTNYLLNNLSQFNLKPTTKLVLLYLSGCYNPKHADVFPKQKTIAHQMGISEASVIRAIQELHKEGLIISERKYTNRYKFTSRILNLGGMVEGFSEANKMQVANSQNERLETCKLQAPCIEQKEKQKIEQTEIIRGGNVYLFQSEEDRILEEYAIKHGARNVKAYINTLKSSGSAKKIIREYKTKRWYAHRAACDIQETQNLIKQQSELEKTKTDFFESEAMLNFAKKHGLKK
jgi:DNA-binding Lrp family transcriptional regulator